MTPKMSVIIPVYNGEKYLRECLDSVLDQTLKNIEVLIVDDGSTDSTRNILRSCQADLPSESGTGHGEYVAFIDADDWIERETYATMYEAAVANNADIVCWDIRKVIAQKQIRR